MKYNVVYLLANLLFIGIQADSIELVSHQQSLDTIISKSNISPTYQQVSNSAYNNASSSLNQITVATRSAQRPYHTPVYQQDMHRMNNEQLAWYFHTHNYTEADILSHPTLYMHAAYLALVKQLPRYQEFVQRYYKKYRQYGQIQKFCAWITSQYTYGMKEQFTRLYQECEEKRLTKETREQKEREQRAQEQRRAYEKKEAEKQDVYKRELKRIDHILRDNSYSYKKMGTRTYEARLEAINTVLQHPERKVRRVRTDQSTLDFTKKYGVTEKQLDQAPLNCYEQQLYTEFITHINHTLAVQRDYQVDDNNIFIDALGNGIALGMQSNHLHNPEWATRWSDFCYEATEIVKGVGEGIVLGSYNAVDMVIHPLRTLVRMTDGIRMLGSLTARTVGTLAHWNYLIERSEYLQCATEMYSIGEQLITIASTIHEQASQLSNREIAKHVTAFGTEWILTGQMFAMGHSLCSNFGHTIRRTIKFLKDEGTAGEFALATTDGILLKTSENLNKSGGSSVNNLINNSNTILETVQAQYMATIEAELEALRLVCDNKVKDIARFGNKYLKPEYEHILGMDLYFSRRGVPQINGFHHDFMGFIEKADVFKFVDKVVYENGFYQARIFYGEEFVKRITFFPSNWSRGQVIEKIYEAYNNFVKAGLEAEFEKGKYLIRGFTDEGIKIEMYITTSGHIKTAYPRF